MAYVGALLQGARGTRLTASAITIQAAYRGMAARRELRRARTAARKIQVSSCFIVVLLVYCSSDALYMLLQNVTCFCWLLAYTEHIEEIVVQTCDNLEMHVKFGLLSNYTCVVSWAHYSCTHLSGITTHCCHTCRTAASACRYVQSN